MYAVEMGSGTVIYIPNFIKNGSGIQTLMCVCVGGGDHNVVTVSINFCFFFQIKK
jgi:hypothetical protein